MEVVIKKEFTDKQLIGFLEEIFNNPYGAGYWCRLIVINSRYKYSNERYTEALVNGGEWIIDEFDNIDEQGNSPIHTVNRATIQRGLAGLAEHYPHIFNNFVTENYDGGDSDNMLQMGVFGKLVYG